MSKQPEFERSPFLWGAFFALRNPEKVSPIAAKVFKERFGRRPLIINQKGGIFFTKKHSLLEKNFIVETRDALTVNSVNMLPAYFDNKLWLGDKKQFSLVFFDRDCPTWKDKIIIDLSTRGFVIEGFSRLSRFAEELIGDYVRSERQL